MTPPNARIAWSCPCCQSTDLERSPAILMPFVAHRTMGWTPVEIDPSWGLKTIASGHAYSICNSVLCARCSLLFLDIRFSDDELAHLYDNYRGEAYTRLREHYEPGYAGRNTELGVGINYLGEIESFLTPHLNLPVSVLDWGGDTGKNTPFKSANTRFDIFDISGAPTVPGATVIEEADLKARRYDLIVCSNVLEHVPHPIDFLSRIVTNMDADTLLYLEVPLETLLFRHGGAPDLLQRKRHWHEHINFFTRDALINLVDRVGLDLIELATLPVTHLGSEAHVFQLACRIKPPSDG